MRLAQRVPVRIHIDEVPEGVKLVAGLTATVQIEPFAAPPVAAAPGKVSKAETELATYEPEAQPKPQPPAAANPAPTLPAPPQAPGQSATAPAPQAAAPALLKAPQQQPAPPAAGAGGLDVSAPPSAAASNAAAAASADLKTLEQQIATNPPSGAGQSRPASPAAAPPSSRRANISGRPSTSRAARASRPSQRRRSPDSIRRRARSRWRHTYER